MLVMKFGGTSVADATRILAVADIVRSRLDRRPVVVVSALAGVTDLLVRAVDAAREGERERLEPILADLERRHRWAVAGSVEDPQARHDLTLAVDALFEDLHQLLRSVRILGEGTPRASDTLLAFGETLSARILAAAFRASGIPAVWVEPREIVITDDRHGAAEPDLEAVAERCRARILPRLADGEVPVVGGFVGATRRGRTTTLGRGGSDTSASVLGAALGAEEIQIWTDVQGLMSADPRLVPEARTLERVSFAEAAELSYYGARVLHPHAIAPAVSRRIPVRILNSLNPEGPGTVIVDEAPEGTPALASVASRGGLCTARVSGRTLRVGPALLPRVLEAFSRDGVVPDLVVASEVAVTLVLREGGDLPAVGAALGSDLRLEWAGGRAMLSVVGSGLARDGSVRGQVLDALAGLGPELLALGSGGASVSAVVPESRLRDAVREVHRRFFEERAA